MKTCTLSELWFHNQSGAGHSLVTAMFVLATAMLLPRQPVTAAPPEVDNIRDLGSATVSCADADTSAKLSLLSDPASMAGGGCDFRCDFCWCGTEFENNCPSSWFSDADCDCGCQFCDLACSSCGIQDCGGEPCGSECDYCWFGEPEEDNCPEEWCGAADGCDCGCQFSDADCPGGTCGVPCGAECDYCWVGTEFQDNCPAKWCGTDDGCDCGCQFSDADCPGGACSPRCGAECVFCWVGTEFQDNCPVEWCGTDDGCDCGCQFSDADCPGGACGCVPACRICTECVDGVCHPCCEDGDSDRDGDIDLHDFAFFQRCFDSGSPVLTECEIADLDCDHDVDLADYNIFFNSGLTK